MPQIQGANAGRQSGAPIEFATGDYPAVLVLFPRHAARDRANGGENMSEYTFSGPLGGRELLTIAQAQLATGLGKTSIFELIKSGRLERVRILSTTRVTRRSVERLIAAGLKAEA